MKRLIVILITVILLFCGCGSADTDANTGTGANVNTDINTEGKNDGKVDDGRIVIALVDTGISTTAITSEKLLAGHNYVTGTEDTEDRINHGTAVASIMAGCVTAEVAAKAEFAYLVPLVVADKVDGETSQADADTLAQVIRDAVDVYHADIINLSLGVKTDTEALKTAVDYAKQRGVVLIAAVGNGGETGTSYYPASYDSVLAVGSCDKKGEVSSFSQSGADVLAQGEGILLASRNGVSYGIKGTSFAAGIVSAYAARLLWENPEISWDEMCERVKAVEKVMFEE